VQRRGTPIDVLECQANDFPRTQSVAAHQQQQGIVASAAGTSLIDGMQNVLHVIPGQCPMRMLMATYDRGDNRGSKVYRYTPAHAQETHKSPQAGADISDGGARVALTADAHKSIDVLESNLLLPAALLAQERKEVGDVRDLLANRAGRITAVQMQMFGKLQNQRGA
jgi:hypothetical protein